MFGDSRISGAYFQNNTLSGDSGSPVGAKAHIFQGAEEWQRACLLSKDKPCITRLQHAGKDLATASRGGFLRNDTSSCGKVTWVSPDLKALRIFIPPGSKGLMAGHARLRGIPNSNDAKRCQSSTGSPDFRSAPDNSLILTSVPPLREVLGLLGTRLRAQSTLHI